MTEFDTIRGPRFQFSMRQLSGSTVGLLLSLAYLCTLGDPPRTPDAEVKFKWQLETDGWHLLMDRRDREFERFHREHEKYEWKLWSRHAIETIVVGWLLWLLAGVALRAWRGAEVQRRRNAFSSISAAAFCFMLTVALLWWSSHGPMPPLIPVAGLLFNPTGPLLGAAVGEIVGERNRGLFWGWFGQVVALFALLQLSMPTVN